MELIKFILMAVLPSGCVGTAIGWLVSKRNRDNDFLANLQSSIDFLSERNDQLLKELVTVKLQNMELKTIQEKMKGELEELRRENLALKQLIDEKFENVRTITRNAK